MKNKILFLLITWMFLISPNCFAATVEYDVVYNQSAETDLITVSGIADVTYAGEEVTLIVLKKDKTFEELDNSDSSDVFNVVRYTDRTTTGENGNFSFTIPVDESFVNGMVYAGVGGQAFNKIHKFSIVYISDPSVIYNAFHSAQLSEDTNAMIDFVENYKADLGLNTDEYSEVTDGVAAYLKVVSVSENDVVKDVYDAFNGAMLKEMLKKAESTEKITSALDKYDIYGNFERTDYNALLEKGGGDEVANFITNSLCTTPENALDALNSAVFLELSNKASNKEELQRLFEKYNQQYLGIETIAGSLYANADKGELFKNLSIRIQTKPVRSITEYIAAFSSSIPLITSGSNGGSGGGGGSAGSGVKIEVELPSKTDEVVEEEKIFDDLSEVLWAEKSILNLVEKNIISKSSDAKFRPHDKVTREEYVKMLVTALGIFDEKATVNFNDVKNDAWYAAYIGSALKYKIINGVSESEFGTGRPITREDMAVMLMRAAGVVGISFKEITSHNFTDSELVSDYALSAVEDMAKAQIINGYENGEFKPKNNATRAEAAVMFDRFLQQQKGIQK